MQAITSKNTAIVLKRECDEPIYDMSYSCLGAVTMSPCPLLDLSRTNHLGAARTKRVRVHAEDSSVEAKRRSCRHIYTETGMATKSLQVRNGAGCRSGKLSLGKFGNPRPRNYLLS